MDISCQATPEWWDEETWRRYYYAARVSSGIAVCKLDCAEPLQHRRPEGGIERVRFRGRKWGRIPLRLKWDCEKPAPPGTNWMNPRHWHTSFHLDELPCHVDFLGFDAYGPHRKLREYRVFVAGREIARGGGKLGFIMALYGELRNWPLAVTVDQYLIYIGTFIQGWHSVDPGQVKTEDVLSAWREIADEQTARDARREKAT
jgi:hypothetical protein